MTPSRLTGCNYSPLPFRVRAPGRERQYLGCVRDPARRRGSPRQPPGSSLASFTTSWTVSRQAQICLPHHTPLSLVSGFPSSWVFLLPALLLSLSGCLALSLAGSPPVDLDSQVFPHLPSSLRPVSYRSARLGLAPTGCPVQPQVPASPSSCPAASATQPADATFTTLQPGPAHPPDWSPKPRRVWFRFNPFPTKCPKKGQGTGSLQGGGAR